MHPSVCVLYLEKFIYLLKTEAGKYWAGVLASSNCQITCTSLFPSHKKESCYKNCTYWAFSIIMSNRCHSIQQNINCSFQITCRNVCKWERKSLSNLSFQRKRECNICCFACFIPLRIIFTDLLGCYCCFGCFFPLSLRIIFPDPQTQMVISGLSMEHACQWFSIVWAFVLSAQTNMAVCTFSFLNPPLVCLKTSSIKYCIVLSARTNMAVNTFLF